MDAAYITPWTPAEDSSLPSFARRHRQHAQQGSISSQDSTETTPPDTPEDLFFDKVSPASSDTSYGSSSPPEGVATDDDDDLNPEFQSKRLAYHEEREGAGDTHATPRLEQPEDPAGASQPPPQRTPSYKRQNPGLALDLSGLKSALPRSVRCPSAPRIGCLPSPAFSDDSSAPPSRTLSPAVVGGELRRPQPVSRFSDETLVSSSGSSDNLSGTATLEGISPVDPTSPLNPLITVVAPPPDDDSASASLDSSSAMPVSLKRPKGSRPPRLNLEVGSQNFCSQSEPITPRTAGALESFGLSTDEDAHVPATRRLRACRSFPVDGGAESGPSARVGRRPRSPLAGPALQFGQTNATSDLQPESSLTAAL